MTETATFSMQEVNTLGLSVNAQDACSLQGIRRQKSVLHVSQSLLSQHLQKDSKQHFSPLTFLYGRCRGLLCIRDFSRVGGVRAVHSRNGIVCTSWLVLIA